jgi:protein-tyrosine phosphatase
MPRPRGGDWLEEEVRSLQRSGVDVLVSLLTAEEIADLELAQEEAICRSQGIQFRSFPIVDRSVPATKATVKELVSELASNIAVGRNIAIHCRQGIGRSALIAICLLVQKGMDVDLAMQRVSDARGCPVPETNEQKRWIMDYAKEPLVSLSK